MRRNRKYTVEFKKQAVDLAATLESVQKAGEQLGIPFQNIHKWRTEFSLQADGLKRPGVVETEQQELERLKLEVAGLKKANYILKSAAAFFSQDHLK